MRKKIFSATFVVAMVAIAGYNTYVNQNKNEMPDLALANVEALAGPEGEEIVTCGTGSKPFNNMIKCPACKVFCGLSGTEFFKTIGYDSKYKYGKDLDLYYCGCNPHLPESYSRAKVRNCSK